jgi:hypothetical protein
MIGWLIGLLPGLGGLLSKGLDYYIQKANGDVLKAQALMAADVARIQAHKEITKAQMGHTVYWVVWAMYTGSLGFYVAKVLVWDKALGLGSTDPITGLVADWAGMIVISLFGMQVAQSVIGKIFK